MSDKNLRDSACLAPVVTCALEVLLPHQRSLCCTWIGLHGVLWGWSRHEDIRETQVQPDLGLSCLQGHSLQNEAEDREGVRGQL